MADQGSVTVGHTRDIGVNQQYIATYNKTFAEKHTVSLLAGFEHYSLTAQSLSGSNKKLYNPTIAELNNAIYETPSVSSSTGKYKTQGFLFRAQYDSPTNISSRLRIVAMLRRASIPITAGVTSGRSAVLGSSAAKIS